MLEPWRPDGQLRIVRLDGTPPDQNGVETCTEGLDVPACDLSGHRNLMLADTSDGFVGRHGELQDNIRQRPLQSAKMPSVSMPCLGFEEIQTRARCRPAEVARTPYPQYAGQGPSLQQPPSLLRPQ